VADGTIFPRAVARGAALLAAFVFLAAATPLSQQFPFNSGQSVAPVFEGWRRHPDGTIGMLFGYMNRNHQETLDLPVGPRNFFEPGPEDRGQPTHFLTRRQPFVFEVLLPKNWDPKARLTWTLTANGVTEKVQGSMQPHWYADDGIIQSVLPGAPMGTPPLRAKTTAPTVIANNNEPPRVTGQETATVTIGQTVNLSVTATDDGKPEPRAGRGGTAASGSARSGVTVRWIHYRGPGKVTFTAPSTTGERGKPVDATTGASFTEPGTVVVRAIASDGVFHTPHDVVVTVKK
jgi:hypothetical protein